MPRRARNSAATSILYGSHLAGVTADAASLAQGATCEALHCSAPVFEPTGLQPKTIVELVSGKLSASRVFHVEHRTKDVNPGCGSASPQPITAKHPRVRTTEGDQ
jgi:hypothetical protein